MKLNDKFLPYAVILGVVAIVAIVTLFMGKAGVEGNTVRWVETSEESYFPCVDEDSENDFYTAGVVKYGTLLYHDYCLNEKTLYQYYCPTSNTVRVLAYECPRGCVEGICLG